MTRALIVGANGQDGTFLVRRLLEKQYYVMGVGRQQKSRWDIRSPLFNYAQADLTQPAVLSGVLNSFRPHQIYHVAAVHMSAEGSYESCVDSVLQVNVGSVHTILEYLRQNCSARLCYASSAKVFGGRMPEIINEKTPMKNECIYSISKNTAFNLIDYYRQAHAVNASVVYLFNHESELRPEHFFIPKVVHALAMAILRKDFSQKLYTLDFYCDWGCAEEYMGLVIDALESQPRVDYILATGNSAIYARDLAQRLFNKHELNYQRYLIESNQLSNNCPQPYKVSTEKLRQVTGSTPKRDIYEVCNDILLKKYGDKLKSTTLESTRLSNSSE